MVFAYNTVNNAAREPDAMTVNQTLADIQARGANHAVALDLSPGQCRSATSHHDNALRGGATQITTCLAVVLVTYDYSAATPIISALVGPITVTGEGRFPVEFNCVDGAASTARSDSRGRREAVSSLAARGRS